MRSLNYHFSTFELLSLSAFSFPTMELPSTLSFPSPTHETSQF